MPVSISLSLVSHTNVGKTTLARTLLGREVGDVRDAPHVTDSADEHELLRSPEGDSLRLWDTPGFGDSARLAKRMRASANPIGWFLSEVWDRWRDRPFWASQQALRNVRDRADIVLYLVNAAEEPAAAGYVAPEMDLLDWLGKPVLVLLNQIGAPRTAAEDEADVQRWRSHLAGRSRVQAVLPLDAFARCWVQEGVLWRAVEAALAGTAAADVANRAGRTGTATPGSSASTTSVAGTASAAMARLRATWAAQRLATFEASMQALAGSLGRIAAARVPFESRSALRSTLREWGDALGLPGGGRDPNEAAQQSLAQLIDDELRSATDALISLHGLRGQAREQALAQVATHFELRLKVDEGRAALLGGVVSGALTGLKADLLSGGLTLGGGLLAGGLLGALGAAGAARGLNLMRGTERSWVGCSAEALDLVLRAALLRYLAVAHFGRGRGDWVDGQPPAHWLAAIEQALSPLQPQFSAIWQRRRAGIDNTSEGNPLADQLSDALQPLLARSTRAVLEGLYPGTWPDATALPSAN